MIYIFQLEEQLLNHCSQQIQTSQITDINIMIWIILVLFYYIKVCAYFFCDD